MDERLNYALSLAAKGYRIIPQDRGKRACIPWKDSSVASSDEAQIREWRKTFPSANFAVHLGASGIAVIDADIKEGKTGDKCLARLEEEHGKIETLRVRTGSGGYQLHLRVPNGETFKTINQLPGYEELEFLAGKKLATLPGSIYSSGAQYTVIDDSEIADMPGFLVELVRKKTKKRKTTKAGEKGEEVSGGNRNNYLIQRAGAMRRQSFNFEAIFEALKIENRQKCNPPLEDDEVQSVAESVCSYNPKPDFLLYKLTEGGNADRMALLFGDDLAYCDKWKQWFIWDGKRWRLDETRKILRVGREVTRQLYLAAEHLDDEEEREAFQKHAKQSDTLAKIRAMTELASSDPKIAIMPTALDQDPMLLTVNNGTIDLRTGMLLPHKKGDYITKLAPVDYKAGADCPQWGEFLKRIFDGNDETTLFVQRALGYSLTADVSEQVMFLPYGHGCNGKSTLLNTASDVLGDYAIRTPTDSLMVKQGDSIPNDIARLVNSRLVLAMEAEQGKRLAESLIKSLTGGDVVTARFLRAEFFQFKPGFKLWLCSNHRPNIWGQDDAIWRRVRMIPFGVRIPEEEQDKRLLGKLREEMPGILNWMLLGCLGWQEHGLTFPPEVKEATLQYRTDMDILADFIEQRIENNRTSCIQSSILFEAYRQYCDANGEKHQSNRWLTARMEGRGYKRQKNMSGRFWDKVRLKLVDEPIGQELEEGGNFEKGDPERSV